MADYSFNCVPSFNKERMVYFILGNKLHMRYAFICTIQARGEYKGLSREYYLTIISLLGNIILDQY